MTVFKCSRCGYEHEDFQQFKKHLARKTECKPKVSDISIEDVKRKYLTKKKRVTNFGSENRDAIKRETLKQYVEDPLKGIQNIIKDIYFNREFEGNHTVRLVADDDNYVEIHLNDTWIKRDKCYIYDKMIYLAQTILEFNIPKKQWTDEFNKFVNSMEEMDNEDLLELIREEIDDTIITAEKELLSSSP